MIDKKLFAMVVLGLTNGSEKLLEILDKEWLALCSQVNRKF